MKEIRDLGALDHVEILACRHCREVVSMDRKIVEERGFPPQPVIRQILAAHGRECRGRPHHRPVVPGL